MDDDGSVVIQVFGKVKETDQTFSKSFNRYIEEPDLDMKVILHPLNLKCRTAVTKPLKVPAVPFSRPLGSTPNP